MSLQYSQSFLIAMDRRIKGVDHLEKHQMMFEIFSLTAFYGATQQHNFGKCSLMNGCQRTIQQVLSSTIQHFSQ